MLIFIFMTICHIDVEPIEEDADNIRADIVKRFDGDTEFALFSKPGSRYDNGRITLS